jgi:hypothetical protein
MTFLHRLSLFSTRDQTILWNPSRDPQIPNYAFIEYVLPFLNTLSTAYTITLISPVSTPEERTAITSLLRNAGLFEGVIDPRRVLFCEMEEGKVHIIKHIGASVHIEGASGAEGESIVENIRNFVGRVVWIVKRLDKEDDDGGEKVKEENEGVAKKSVDRSKWVNVEISDALITSNLSKEFRRQY